MSLLLKALQNAAKNREAAMAAGESHPPTADTREASQAAGAELTLEPVQPTAGGRAQTPPRATVSSRAQAAATDDFIDRTAAPSPLQAQSVLHAGAAQRAGSGLMGWLERRPLVAFSTAAGLFAIGYGVYLYLQITNPGVFTARRTPPPPPAVAQAPVPPQPPAAAPVPPAPVPTPAIDPPSIPGASGTPAPGPGVPGPSVAAPPPVPGVAPAITPAPPASAPTSGGALPPLPSAPIPPAATASIGSPMATAPVTAKPAGPRMAPAGGPVVASVTPAPAPARPRPRATRSPAPKRDASTALPAAAGSQIVPVDATLASAYQALEKGQLNDAERMYRQVIASNPTSVDALLGLASTLAQQNKSDAATPLYMRVLEQEPRNAYAQAGLLAIGGRADPVAAEARLKQLIARDPSGYLYFTLGNLYSEQGQWAAAQGAYFQAHNLAPDNPDYAFNLAVGLEHVSQPKIALDYYRRALALAQSRGNAQFDPARVQSRIRSLESALAERP